MGISVVVIFLDFFFDGDMLMEKDIFNFFRICW